MIARRGAQTTITVVAGVTQISKAPSAASMPRSAPTTDSVSDSATLARHLREIHNELDRHRINAASVMSGATFLNGVAIAVGTNYIEHRLGRAPVGVFSTLSTTAQVLNATLPATHDPAKFFAVSSTVVQVVSFLVF